MPPRFPDAPTMPDMNPLASIWINHTIISWGPLIEKEKEKALTGIGVWHEREVGAIGHFVEQSHEANKANDCRQVRFFGRIDVMSQHKIQNTLHGAAPKGNILLPRNSQAPVHQIPHKASGGAGEEVHESESRSNVSGFRLSERFRFVDCEQDVRKLVIDGEFEAECGEV